MKILLFVPLTFLLASCSGGKSASDGVDAGIELADAVEFSEGSEDMFGEDFSEGFNDPMADSFAEDSFAEDSFAEDSFAEESFSDDAMAEPVFEAPATAEAPVQVDPVSEAPVAMGGGVETYTVKENETLMMVAFHIYGDYEKWREIAGMNQDKLQGSTVISPGMQLKYNAPAQPFVFNPSGNPYLILEGDTLGRISHKTYGVQQYWKDIWDNNRPLIKDPNIIFAGFTIYTPVIEGRDVAFDGL